MLEEERAHYLTRVLRVSVGQTVTVFNGDGWDYTAEVGRIERTAVGLQLADRVQACSEPPLHITLVQAVSRGERMDFTLQKATELGVSALQPVFSLRTEVRIPEGKLEQRMRHWRGVVISACEQSGRASLPELRLPLDVRSWAQQESTATRIMLMPGAEPMTRLSFDSAVEILIGPEGGFDDHEVAYLRLRGLIAAGLGPRILRTETAGLAAIAVIQALAGDLGR